MSVAIVTGAEAEGDGPDEPRDPWPAAQFGNVRRWKIWAEEDALPLASMVKINIKPEFESVFEPFEDAFYFVPNAYYRGGTAWGVAYAHASVAYAEHGVLPLGEFETSDLDTVASKLKNKPTPVLKRGQTWPTKEFRTPRDEVYVRDVGLDDILREEPNKSEGVEIDFDKLEACFPDGLRFVISETRSVRVGVDDISALPEDFDDVPNKWHANNVSSYVPRYGLSSEVPYLMRVPGAGFVETPTIQIGQLLDSMSDYVRCAEWSAAKIKAKFARRSARLLHAWDVHRTLVGAGFREANNPFVLSRVVAGALERFVRDDADALRRATSSKTCREAEVTGKHNETREVRMQREIDCEDARARMNCAALPGRYFRGRATSSLYEGKDRVTLVDALEMKRARE